MPKLFVTTDPASFDANKIQSTMNSKKERIRFEYVPGRFASYEILDGEVAYVKVHGRIPRGHYYSELNAAGFAAEQHYAGGTMPFNFPNA